MQSCSQAEPHSADKGVGEPHSDEIRVGIRANEKADLGLGGEKRGDRIVEGRRWSRLNLLWGLASEPGPHRRLERSHKPTANQSGSGRSPSSASLAKGALGDGPHRLQIDPVGDRQMVEAFRNAPRVRGLPPGSQVLAEPVYEAVGLALDGVQRRFERHNIRAIIGSHAPYPMVWSAALSIPEGMEIIDAMARIATGAVRLGEPTLTASDWAEAALQLIAEKGLRALTVTALASRLGVTKGSFYWHFQSRSELLRAALARWEQGATSAAIKGLEAITDARRRLELMLDAASQPPRARSLYAALAEAAEDPVVRDVLNRVASERIAYLETCYRTLGLSPAMAKSHAVFAYAAYRGLLQLAHEAPAALPTDWSSYPGVIRNALVPKDRVRARSSGRR
jgi:AcrR family transcriptional regulator